jgi:integrase
MPYRPKGSRIYWISFTDESGRRTRESTGTADKREAESLEARRREAVRRVTKFGEKVDRTYDEVLAAYLKATTNKRSHDRDLTSAAHLTPHFTGRSMRSLGASDIKAYKAMRKAHVRSGVARPPSDLTVSKELLLLSGAIRYCNAELDWDIPNPVTGRAKQPRKRKTPRWLTLPEAQDLLDAAMRVKRAPHLRDFIELALATGMRKDEILGLEWRRVSEENRSVWFEGDDTKNGRSQSIPLNETALAVLKRRRTWIRAKGMEESPWVFPSRKKPGARILNVKTAFREACRIAGIKNASPHTTRHTFTSWMVQSGEDLRKVAGVLRHEDIRTTMLYAHLAPNKGTETAAIDRLMGIESGHDSVKVTTKARQTGS